MRTVFVLPSEHVSMFLTLVYLQTWNTLTLSRSFSGQAPVALLGLLAVIFKFAPYPPQDTAKEDGHSGNLQKVQKVLNDVDWLGAILSALAITTGLGVISVGGTKLLWYHPVVVLAAMICFMSALSFVLVEMYGGRKPLIPPKLISYNGIGAICVVQVLLNASRFGVSSMILSFREELLTFFSHWRKSQAISCERWI